MLYALFRGLSRVSLRWFYRDVTVLGRDRVPRDGPLLLAVNHPNALVDALAAVAVVPRRVTLTAKATLWEHPALALLLPRVGIVPLRRAQDERRGRGASPPRGVAGVTRQRPSGGPGGVTRERPAGAAGGVSGEGGTATADGEAANPGGAQDGSRPPDGPAGAGTVVEAAAGDAIVSLGGGPRATAVGATHPTPPSPGTPPDTPPDTPPRTPEGRSGVTPDTPATPARNAASFGALIDALARGGAVLLFPEGKSHSEPALAPLKTGLARIALEARDGRGVRDLRIVPIGLVFERKWQPRSRVLVQVGEPLVLDAWSPPPGARPVEALTEAVDARLRTVTLNFETAGEEARTLGAARLLAAAFEGDRPVGRADTPLQSAVAMAQRIEAARARLAAGGALPPRAEQFLGRLAALRREAARHGVMLEDAEIATGLIPGVRFTVREALLALVQLPVALWGAVHHFLPLRLAWTLARRRSRNLDDPAMQTIVAGLGLVLAFYAVQGALVAWLAGPWWAAAYLLTLPPAAVVELRLRDRLRRALRRARTYRLFRRDPALRARFAAELAWVRGEAVELERV